MPGNGTAGPVLHRIIEKLNLDATELYFEMDGNFPNHHPDPTVPAKPCGLEEARSYGNKRNSGSPLMAIAIVSVRSMKRLRYLRRHAAVDLRTRDSIPQTGRDVSSAK